MYSVHSVTYHNNVIVENVSLIDCILVQLLMRRRYDFECAIYDEDGYIVPGSEIEDALEDHHSALSAVHPLTGLI
jgi:hypothetical protein